MILNPTKQTKIFGRIPHVMHVMHVENSLFVTIISLYFQELTPQVERQFFFALSKLKQNDPEIYDPTKCFFNVNKRDTDDTSKKKQRERPMFLRDYEREMLLKTGEIQNCNGEYFLFYSWLAIFAVSFSRQRATR